MFLALREMRRAKARFAFLIAAVALLAFLILFQLSLQNGLLRSFVGAIENQTAPVLVYSVDGQNVAQASIITPDLEAAVRALPEVGAAGRWTQGSFAASAEPASAEPASAEPATVESATGDPGPASRTGELVDVSVVGYDTEGLGSPVVSAGRLPAAPGEVVASDADASAGFAIGEVVRIEPGGYALTVVGHAAEIQLNAGPTMFAPMETYAAVLRARNPDARQPLPNLLALRPADGVTEAALIAAVNGLGDDLAAYTRADAAAQTPGVAEVRSSFSVIFLLYGIVVPLVIGLFFLIVTFQKAGALTLLRAVGIAGGRLVRSMLIQVLIVLGLGYAIGVALYTPLSRQRLGQIPLRFEAGGVILWAVLLIGLGVLASLVAARRVLRIDPVEATTGAGVGR